jgi:hypothetical protein
MWPFNILKSEFIEFINFLESRNILSSSIGFILAFQINNLFLNIIDDVVKPVASKVVAEDINKHTVNIFGFKLRIGRLFFSILHVFIILVFIFYIYRLSTESTNIFSNLVETVKNYFK